MHNCILYKRNLKHNFPHIFRILKIYLRTLLPSKKNRSNDIIKLISIKLHHILHEKTFYVLENKCAPKKGAKEMAHAKKRNHARIVQIIRK